MKKIKVHYLFSKNKKIGSKLIAWGTAHRCDVDDVPSHVAILVEERWVYESTLSSGVRVIPYKKWKEINTEVAKIECEQEWTYEEFKVLFKSIKDLEYDWFGVLYLGFHLIPNKLFGIPLPENNLFAHDFKYFCCEVMGKMTGVNYDMTCPVDIMVELQNNNNIED